MLTNTPVHQKEELKSKDSAHSSKIIRNLYVLSLLFTLVAGGLGLLVAGKFIVLTVLILAVLGLLFFLAGLAGSAIKVINEPSTGESVIADDSLPPPHGMV